MSIVQVGKMIKAEIIADSISSKGKRLTTFVLHFPRIVLAEFNTHRALSRNSASSRAIPFKKMMKLVKENPFIPMKWMKEHTGMQGSEYFGEKESSVLETLWLESRDSAVAKAEALSQWGLTKQFCNRLLEPFMWHTVICTGSEWENFFALRSHPDAEIHIQALADKMLEVYNNSVPTKLEGGEWHIPFGDSFDPERLREYAFKKSDGLVRGRTPIEDAKIRIATARCARVSYLNFEGKDDYDADLELHDRLCQSGHMSPFEHCAMNMEDEEVYGNFIGWKQYRKHFNKENRTDERVKKYNSS